MDAAGLIADLHGVLLRHMSSKMDINFEGLRSAAAHARRQGLLSNSTVKKLCRLDDAYSVTRHITKVYAAGFADKVLNELQKFDPLVDPLVDHESHAEGGGEVEDEEEKEDADQPVGHNSPSGREAHAVPTHAHVPLHSMASTSQVSNEIHHMFQHRQLYADIAEAFTKHTKDAVDIFIDQYMAQSVDYPPELLEKQLATSFRRGFLGLVPALAQAPPSIEKFINKLVARDACLTAVRAAAARKRYLDSMD
eukprot:TRINITY_DN28216_c0_g1_i4.p1 TRINITY_DN28216_c0_g1~~TRINITY_DN28216_c0_g1_i4.p1  ORF type:complete len:279 (+),score=40.90 TRINITY_DN28216_c0_g1_i4:86-838(+)